MKKAVIYSGANGPRVEVVEGDEENLYEEAEALEHNMDGGFVLLDRNQVAKLVAELKDVAKELYEAES